MSNFWSESLSTSILCVCKQQRRWQVYAGPESSLLDDVISTKILSDCPHTFSLARMNHMQVTTLTLCMLGNFSFLCLFSADFFQNFFFKNTNVNQALSDKKQIFASDSNNNLYCIAL